MDYDIGKAFERIEDELIASMIRNLSKHEIEEISRGYSWSQWQVTQLKALEDYKRRNKDKFSKEYQTINQNIRLALQNSYKDGATKQERQILQAIKRGYKGVGTNKPNIKNTEINGEFFTTNNRKLDALITATTHDMVKAETATLRMANDQYRKIIFDAQVYANTGAGTYRQAVDMATKSFLQAGINSIQYKNGRRVNIKSYAEMAIRTANKRAYLQGEGEMRKEWGISTVIVQPRGNPCPLCLEWVGKVLVDDVWSGGTAEEAQLKGYPLMSEAIAGGLYHPNCKDVHTTYFEDLNEPEKPTEDDNKFAVEDYNQGQKLNYAENQADKFKRLAKYSLDKDNKRAYSARAVDWQSKANEIKSNIQRYKNSIANPGESGIIKTTEMLRKKVRDRSNEIRVISDYNFERLTIKAKKQGAIILRGSDEVEKHLDSMNADAAILGDVILFRSQVCMSEVLEETYHFEQNLNKMNDDKPEPLRTYLNEIDAKEYLLRNAKKYNIPHRETELTKKQLDYYKGELKKYMKE